MINPSKIGQQQSSLKDGEWNNCLKCGSSYSAYDNNPNSNWKEGWSQIPISGKEPKGLCQFCNSKTSYYNKY